jgi:hypothetical protein
VIRRLVGKSPKGSRQPRDWNPTAPVLFVRRQSAVGGLTCGSDERLVSASCPLLSAVHLSTVDQHAPGDLGQLDKSDEAVELTRAKSQNVAEYPGFPPIFLVSRSDRTSCS